MDIENSSLIVFSKFSSSPVAIWKHRCFSLIPQPLPARDRMCINYSSFGDDRQRPQFKEMFSAAHFYTTLNNLNRLRFSLQLDALKTTLSARLDCTRAQSDNEPISFEELGIACPKFNSSILSSYNNRTAVFLMSFAFKLRIKSENSGRREGLCCVSVVFRSL